MPGRADDEMIKDEQQSGEDRRGLTCMAHSGMVEKLDAIAKNVGGKLNILMWVIGLAAASNVAMICVTIGVSIGVTGRLTSVEAAVHENTARIEKIEKRHAQDDDEARELMMRSRDHQQVGTP